MRSRFVSSVFVLFQKLHFTFLHIKISQEFQGNLYLVPIGVEPKYLTSKKI